MSVRAKNSYILEITFENNETKTFNVRPYLDFGVFTELKDKYCFRQIKPFWGSIAWPHGQDICPDTLYMDGK
jgi:hypothetical protein